MAYADIAFLEQKLKRLERVVQDISSCANTNHNDGAARDGIEISFSDPFWQRLPDLGRVDSTISLPPDQWAAQSQSSDNSGEDFLETLSTNDPSNSIHVEGTMTIYRGKKTGVEVFRVLRDLCDSFLGLRVNSDNAAMKMANALDSTFPTHSNSTTSLARTFFASEKSVKRWIDIAFSQAFILWPFIDREAFDIHAQRLIEQGHHGRHKSNDDELGLVHAVIALGQRHDAQLINTKDKHDLALDPPG